MTDSQIVPTPRDGAPVVVVAVDGVPMTWIGETPGTPGDGNLAGDGSETSRRIVAEAHRLWEDQIEVDHPSWNRPFWTVPGDPVGVLATLLHLGHGRGRVLQAPEDALDELFAEPADYAEEGADVPGE